MVTEVRSGGVVNAGAFSKMIPTGPPSEVAVEERCPACGGTGKQLTELAKTHGDTRGEQETGVAKAANDYVRQMLADGRLNSAELVGYQSRTGVEDLVTVRAIYRCSFISKGGFHRTTLCSCGVERDGDRWIVAGFGNDEGVFERLPLRKDWKQAESDWLLIRKNRTSREQTISYLSCGTTHTLIIQSSVLSFLIDYVDNHAILPHFCSIALTWGIYEAVAKRPHPA